MSASGDVPESAVKSSLRRWRPVLWPLAALLALGVGLGGSRVGPGRAIIGAASAAAAVTQLQLPDFTSIVRKYGATVVNVSVTSMEQGPGPQLPGLNPNDPFYFFFRQFQQREPRQTPVRGIGSGFIIRADGLIVTNAHVVRGAQSVVVTLTDKRQFKARVIGADVPTDVAVLKIDATGLPTVKIGDPSKVQVGQWVVAIGSPYNFENSVTAGIVSAKARSLPNEGYVPFIQTDVPVNPGNSGGPLFDLDGEVIGVNSQIYTGTGGYQGISFAVPIDVAMHTAEQLIAHGRVERGRLGIEIQSVDQDLALAFGLQRPEGALVSAVQADGPAAKAGLRPGDVILRFNGHSIADSSELPLLVAAVRPGEPATLTIWRDRGVHQLRVTVGGTAPAQSNAAAQAKPREGELGLQLRPLTSEERAQARVPSGLIVESAGGAAAAAGIEAGDIVLAVDGHSVGSLEQFRALLARAGRHVALLIDRNDARIFVPLQLG